MTVHNCAVETSRLAAPATIAARLTAAANNFYRNWKNRRDFYRLGELSDAELADIGLTRSDLHVAMSGPFGNDPTMRLRELASERIDSIEDAARKIG
ncbi:DUF1127 domain-containing protein [Manganibacter manganicus]|uniref:YjiS-like domain-containing protein n=1 Tax=Manganibacter manganicus TaxID=1873176 RepID=A0A1V8RPY9_9HYPH|nr:DUF1127 domain-containing protein [Pseudaminobacter manganicus]OQM75271.1 hypothetical protein BFN67_19135 [Pseudaminobacter manganicus]